MKARDQSWQRWSIKQVDDEASSFNAVEDLRNVCDDQNCQIFPEGNKDSSTSNTLQGLFPAENIQIKDLTRDEEKQDQQQKLKPRFTKVDFLNGPITASFFFIFFFSVYCFNTVDSTY